MVSVKSTVGTAPAGAGADVWPFTGALGAAALAEAEALPGAGAFPRAEAFPGARALAEAGAAGSALAASSFTALLEMTNRRRTGGAFNFGAFGLLPRVCGVLFAAVALRFNINNQTNERLVGSEIKS